MNEDKSLKNNNTGTLRSTSVSYGEFSSSNLFSWLKANNTLEKSVIPLISETNRTIPISKFLRDVEILVFILQLFAGGAFVLHPTVGGPKGFRQFVHFIFLYSFSNGGEKIQFLVIIGNLIFMFFTLVICYDYYINQVFRPWMLFLFRLLNGHLYNYFIIPTYITLFESVTEYGLKPTTGNAIVVILSFVCIVFSYIQMTYIVQMLGQNTYLQNLHIMYWRSSLLYFSLVVDGLLFGLNRLSRLSKGRQLIIPQVIMIIFSYYQVFVFKVFPYESLYLNTMCLSFSFYCLFCSIISIVNVYRPMPYTIYYLVIFVFFFFVYIGCYIFLKIKCNRVIKQLSGYDQNDESRKLTPNEKNDYFDSLNIDYQSAFIYLEIGVQNGCPLFLDWSLANYLLIKYKDKMELLVFITWMASFFPSESKFLYHCITIGMKLPNNTYFLRCFFHQLQRVNIFRMSALSAECQKDLTDIKKRSNHAKSFVNWFWRNIAARRNVEETVAISFTFQAYSAISETDTVFQQMIEKYPNNIYFIDAYWKYLLDAKCAFRESIIWHQKTTSASNGHLLVNDKMFRCFLQQYPFYLKKRLVDVNGNITINMTDMNKMSPMNANSYSILSTESSSSLYDEEIEIIPEEAESVVSCYRLRMAIEKAMKGIESPIIKRILMYSIFRTILTLILIITVWFFLYDRMESFVLLINQVKSLNALSHNTMLVANEVQWQFITSFPFVSNDTTAISVYEKFFNCSKTVLFYPHNESLNKIIARLTKEGLVYIEDFANILNEFDMNHGSSGNFVTINDESLSQSLINTYVRNKRDNSYCLASEDTGELAEIVKNSSISFDFLVRSYFTTILQIINSSAIERQSWNKNFLFCEIVKKNKYLQKGFTDLVQRLSVTLNYGGSHDTNDLKSMVDFSVIELVIVLVPFASVLLAFPNIINMTIGIAMEIMTFSEIFNSIKPDDALNAAKPLSTDQQKINTTSFNSNSSIADYRLFFDLFLPVVVLVLMLFHVFFCYSEIDNISVLFEHTILTFFRRNLLVEMGRDSLWMVFLSTITEFNYSVPLWNQRPDGSMEVITGMYNISWSSYDSIFIRLKNDFDLYMQSNEILSKGTDTIPPIYGYNNVIDNFYLKSKCETKVDDQNELTNCLSFLRIIDYFLGIIKIVTTTFTDQNFESSRVLEIQHLVDTRFANDFTELMDTYFDLIFDRVNLYNIITYVLLAIEIIMFFVQFFIEMGLKKSLNMHHGVYKSLILHLDPFVIVNDNNIMSFIAGNYDIKSHSMAGNSKIRSFHQAAYSTLKDSVIFVSSDLIIDSFNTVTLSTFSINRDQAYGQSLSIILPQEDNMSLFYQLKLIKNGHEKKYFKCEGYGKRDEFTKIPFRIVVIGFESYNNKNMVDSFALILHDNTKTIEQQTLLEKAKQNSYETYVKIIPKVIRSRIANNQEINFIADSATILAINIDKFSEYSSFLPPSERLTNISKIFQSFEKATKLFPLITTIRVFGDCFYAIGGLFANHITDEIHAVQVVQCAIKCLEYIEDINFQLNANLMIRIGINTGGPLIAGLLSMENPIFEVFGKAMNVAIMLEKRGSPGAIHISQYTYSLVAKLNINFVENGEIRVDDNEKIKTYIATMNPETAGSAKDFSSDKLGFFNAPEDDKKLFTNSSGSPLLDCSTYVQNGSWFHSKPS